MEFLKPYVKHIESALTELNLPEQPGSLYEPQRYMLSNGGKRIRPVLTMMACGMCGADRKKAMPAALAVELLHNFTLMHDDIMDQADSRRGMPSVHKKWNEPVAILSGDSMFTRAMLMLSELDESVDYRKITTVFLRGIDRVCEGQAMDMEFETRQDVTKREYMAMIEGKTAALLEVSLQMGGIVAGCDDEKLAALRLIGENIGYAFQVQDDWLDVVADPEKFGKRVAGDIYESKKTFLMTLALERCNNTQREWLLECLKKKPLSDSDVEQVIELYRELDVIDSAQSEIERLYGEAEQSLEIFGESQDKRDLIQLIRTLKKRDH